MNIVYSCNDYYIQQTGISIISLCENNKDVENISIYFIEKDCSIENIELLKSICEKYHRTFILIHFDDIAFDLVISNVGRHIETIYSKVFFSRIEGLEKAIYLDSDIVVVGSLQQLWDTDLSDTYMGVVQTFSDVKSQLGLPEEYIFFNDGMAIVNVDYCRKHHLIQKVKDVICEYGGNPPTLSEGALNKVCQGKVKYISLRYNLMAGILYFYKLDKDSLFDSLEAYSPKDISESCEAPTCIHFLSGFYNRPWFVPCSHPYKYQYYKYKMLSPWRDIKPIRKKLPFRLRMIDVCFKIFGYKLTNKLRKVFDGTS